MLEQRQLARRNFSYYMLVFDDKTGELIGHWIDISPGGFRLETLKPIPENKDFRFRVDLSNGFSNKSYMVFNARSRWCQMDTYDSNLYSAGFQIANLPPEDSKTFKRMFERYGSEENRNSFSGEYLWK